MKLVDKGDTTISKILSLITMPLSEKVKRTLLESTNLALNHHNMRCKSFS